MVKIKVILSGVDKDGIPQSQTVEYSESALLNLIMEDAGRRLCGNANNYWGANQSRWENIVVSLAEISFNTIKEAQKEIFLASLRNGAQPIGLTPEEVAEAVTNNVSSGAAIPIFDMNGSKVREL